MDQRGFHRTGKLRRIWGLQGDAGGRCHQWHLQHIRRGAEEVSRRGRLTFAKQSPQAILEIEAAAASEAFAQHIVKLR